MMCARCGRNYRDAVPMYCECGTPLQAVTDRWDATVELPQAADMPYRAPDDEMTSSFNSASTRQSAIWPAPNPAPGSYGAYAPDGYAPPPPPHLLAQRRRPRRSLRLLGIALTLVGLAAVALFSAVALAQNRNAHFTTPLAVGQTTPQTAATTTLPATATSESGALSNWAQSANCVVAGDVLHVIGTGQHLNGFLCDAPYPAMQDSTVQAQATFVRGSSTSAVGIAVRVNHADAGVTADEVFLTQHGTLYILQHQPDHTQTIMPSHTVPNAVTGQGATNTIAVGTQGDVITVTVNGQVAAMVTDDGIPTTGTVALAVRGYGQEGAFSGFTLTPGAQATGAILPEPGN